MNLKTFTPRLSILPEPQKLLWPNLEALVKLGFVLHGGTAIALHLGHRESVDFDFFTEHELDKELLLFELPCIRGALQIQNQPNTFTVSIPLGSREVKVSFFGGITFGRVAEPAITSDGVAVVANKIDLLSQKLKTIMQRVEAKDYLDIAALLRSGLSLETGMAGAMALFGPNFPMMESAKAMCYFHGTDLDLVGPEDRAILVTAARGLPDQLIPSPILSSSLTASPIGRAIPPYGRDGIERLKDDFQKLPDPQRPKIDMD